jgi:hypothetical protein
MSFGPSATHPRSRMALVAVLTIVSTLVACYDLVLLGLQLSL